MKDRVVNLRKRGIARCITVCTAIVLIAVIIGLILKCYLINTAPEKNYIISTHYFANEWPKNFWNAEWDTIDQDFEQIRNDGFNTIIVVVPWREFQPEISPIKYNESVWDRIPLLLEKAAKHNLDVQIRAGYLHDFMGDYNSSDRFYQIIWDKNARIAWCDYMGRLYGICSEYENFTGGFITWEDFWHNYRLGEYLAEHEEERLEYARRDLFGEFLSGKYTLEEFNAEYGVNYADFDDIPIPCGEDRYKKEWYECVDVITMEILEETRDVFPDLFMEVRTDDDLMPENEKYSHDITWDCRGGKMTGIMYQIGQGLEVKREQLTAEIAVQMLENWLQKIYDKNGQIPIYMEQFLFYDNTPGNKNGDIILNIDQENYFVNCVPIFKKYTNGYGVWIYRDYCNNLLYNPQFFFGLDGWDAGERVSFDANSGSNRAYLDNDSICQYIPDWRMPASTGERYTFSMDYDASQDTIFTVRIGSQLKVIKVSGKGKLEFQVNEESDMSISVFCDGQAYVDNLKLYNLVSTQLMYGVDNSEKMYIENIRIMNRLMTE